LQVNLWGAYFVRPSLARQNLQPHLITSEPATHLGTAVSNFNAKKQC
jgi:hypothetical protein